MARKKHKAEEIIQHLRTVEIEKSKGTTQEEAARKIGVCVQTYIVTAPRLDYVAVFSKLFAVICSLSKSQASPFNKPV
jgi:hypothetical protein